MDHNPHRCRWMPSPKRARSSASCARPTKEDTFRTKIAALGDELDEQRQLLLFDLEPSRWPN